MLKLIVVKSKHSNLCWFSFEEEFSHRSYGGRTFNTMDEAVNYANDTISYKGIPFDLISINQPSYNIVDSLSIY